MSTGILACHRVAATYVKAQLTVERPPNTADQLQSATQ